MHYTDNNWDDLTFLVADDDHYCHLLLDRVFEKTGVNIVHAYNGSQAVELTLSNEISLAIIDLVMPKLTGYEVASLIKTAKPDIICIAYSADAMRINKELSEKVGFEKVLVKPMLPIHLLKEIDTILEKNKIYK